MIMIDNDNDNNNDNNNGNQDKTKMIIMTIINNCRLELALCLLLAWAIVYGALWKGIKSFGKVIIRTYVHMQGWTKLSPRVCRMKIQHNQSFAIRGETLNYRVFRKNCVFFTIHCTPSLAYIAVRGLQSSQRNGSVQSLLLAGNLFNNQ